MGQELNQMRRVPVQASLDYYRHPRGRPEHAPGTIGWDEHLEAWSEYARRYGAGQSATRIAERGGFCREELRMFLGREPDTFEPAQR